MPIIWDYPPPRSGLKGAWDKFIGPGPTRAELLMQLIIPLAAAVAAVLYAWRGAEGWTPVQQVVSVLLAIDITGGIVTNATSTAKRWYHRQGQGFKDQFGFVALHLLHVVVVSWLFLAFDIPWLIAVGGFLLFSTAVILLVPQYLQRPTAMVCYAGAILLCIYVLRQPEGLEWFLPLLYLKLLVSHLPKEEPYRPGDV
ncbi:MAG: hypothetical protein JRJ09_18650 [Deltaproteobacteria bacterium]|nr:hypothetical protein [Deltaproteobacteria bacterium]MBW2050525.1 hypothetical protein [Deltaproteobacteria bacterium]MBW2113160.1 hypothetical protein [Deltaproteobacteria bacterium]MBW2355093.1 hypothetical protein [Deltaproteobacteria bacterium]